LSVLHDFCDERFKLVFKHLALATLAGRSRPREKLLLCLDDIFWKVLVLYNYEMYPERFINLYLWRIQFVHIERWIDRQMDMAKLIDTFVTFQKLKMMRTILKAQELICYSITDPTLH
jgi:hypothetical protein